VTSERWSSRFNLYVGDSARDRGFERRARALPRSERILKSTVTYRPEDQPADSVKSNRATKPSSPHLILLKRLRSLELLLAPERD